jgi:hypothetical protein
VQITKIIKSKVAKGRKCVNCFFFIIYSILNQLRGKKKPIQITIFVEY